MNRVVELLLLACFLILPYFSFALTSLGSAIMFQITWEIANLSDYEPASDFTLSIVLFLISLAPMIIIMVWLLWDSVDFKLTALLAFPATMTSLIGIEVLVTVNQNWLRRGLGALLLVTYVILIIRKRIAGFKDPCQLATANDLLTWSTFFVSLIIGIFRGLFGLGGPPVMIWAAYHSVPKDICRANLCASLLIQLPVSLTWLLYVKGKWKNDDVELYLASIFGALVGLALGFLAAKRVNERLFQLFLSYVILLSGAVLVGAGLNPLILQPLVALGCTIIGLSYSKLMLRQKLLCKESGRTYEMDNKQHRPTETSGVLSFTPKNSKQSWSVPLLSDSI